MRAAIPPRKEIVERRAGQHVERAQAPTWGLANLALSSVHSRSFIIHTPSECLAGPPSRLAGFNQMVGLWAEG
jgi:hypothetical protein